MTIDISEPLHVASMEHKKTLDTENYALSLLCEKADIWLAAKSARDEAATAHDEALERYVGARKNRRVITGRLAAFDRDWDEAYTNLGKVQRLLIEASDADDVAAIAANGAEYAKWRAAFDELRVGPRWQQHLDDKEAKKPAEAALEAAQEAKDAAKAALDAADETLRKEEQEKKRTSENHSDAERDRKTAKTAFLLQVFNDYAPVHLRERRAQVQHQEDTSAVRYESFLR